MDKGDQTLRHLIQAIDMVQDKPEGRAWLLKLCQPDFNLVGTMIKTFMSDVNHEDYELANNILRTLRKLLTLVPDLVLGQLIQNVQFPVAISDYVVATPIQKLVGDAFVLMVDLFKATSFKPVMNAKFINALMKDLEVIEDEEIFQSIIGMFVNISQQENKDFDHDLVIQTTTKHDNYRYLIEITAQLINKSDQQTRFNCLAFVRKIYSNNKVEFFYKNDFEVVIRVCLREILNAQNENDRYEYLSTLVCLSKTNDFLKEKQRWTPFFEELFYNFEAGIGEKCQQLYQELQKTFQ